MELTQSVLSLLDQERIDAMAQQLGASPQQTERAIEAALIYTAGSVVGFGLSSFAGAFFPPLLILRGGQFTGGASAAIGGLSGAVLAYSHRSGSAMA